MIVKVTDYEITTSNKGNPFDKTNKAVCLALKEGSSPPVVGFGEDIASITKELHDTDSGHDLFVFFNAKFDLHWHRRFGFTPISPVWCCQLAEFYLCGQTNPYPSLQGTAQSYGLGSKLDEVLGYWERGVDTDAIPRSILGDYSAQDVELTYKVYLAQLDRFRRGPPALFALFKIACADLQTLAEMEWNGLAFDDEVCRGRAIALRSRIDTLDSVLASYYPGTPINFNSRDQLSTFLYGGIIIQEYKEAIGTFKTGLRVGEVKHKLCEREIALPRLIEPLEGSELAKEGFFATDEGTLRKLKGPPAKKIVPVLLERAKTAKLIGTYYEGIPLLAKEMNWEDGYVHGQFNQCVAATGRLSSSKPNLQNFSGEMEDVFITRFKEEKIDDGIVTQ